MSDTSPRNQDAIRHDAKAAPPRQPKPGERLFVFRHGHYRFLCELRDHGDFGVEAAFYQNETFLISRTFHQRMDPARPPRALAIAWAEEERKAIEAGQ